MGSPVSGLVAELVLQELEKIAFLQHEPVFWRRYVDDTFVIVKKDMLQHFHSLLNAVFPDIKFTMEEEQEQQLPFLDVLVRRNLNGELETTVYRKATNTTQLLSFHSNHPVAHKRSCVKTLFKRLQTHCSKQEDRALMFTPVNRRKLRCQARRETEEIIRRISEEVGGMPSSDTSSGSWSESDTEESTSSTSLADEGSSSLEGSSLSTDEEFGSTAEGEEEDASPRDSLRKWALRLKISHAHVNELLKALKPWLPDLPADARTLLGSKYVSAPSTAMISGEYMHLGLGNQVNAHLRNLALPPSVKEVVDCISKVVRGRIKSTSFRQQSRKTRLRRIKRYGNEAFQSHRRTPMTFATIPLGDQTDDASDQMPSKIDVIESHWKVISNYWTIASVTNWYVTEFITPSCVRPPTSHALEGKCVERSLDSYVLRKQKTQHPRSFY
ncbi:hypothetical protein SprV_0301234100 [Sparganum proliferum]